MNSSSLYFDPVQTVQFLSLFTYMNKLSDILYSEELIKEEDKFQPFTIVNAFYEYLNGTKNETELKQQIVHKLLEGSDLYGGRENETLDMEYVNKTLDYVVSNVVFSQSGNLYGYLAEIVATSTDLKLSVFKKTVLEHLSHLRYMSKDGNVSNLTELATIKIAENLLWPLFPDPSHDMEIISVKYIYALAGQKFAQSAQMNLSEVSFQKYAILAMTIEASAFGGKLPNSTLQIFALPAIIYYAHNQTAKFNQQPTKNLLKDEEFWSDAFFTLFTYLNSTFETIRQEAFATNSLYQFHKVMSNFKNRTAVARDVLHKECSSLNETYLESLVDDYKTYSVSTRCHPRARLLPNLELVYDAQFHSIREKYRLMEMDFIQSAFDEFPHLRDLINSTNTAVYQSKPKNFPMYCMLCPPMSPKYKRNINFFAVKNERQYEFFALEQNENNVSLLIQKHNKTEFNKRVGLPLDTDLEISTIIKSFKAKGQDFNAFVESVAKFKAEEFRKQLFEYGYEKTSMEKLFEIIEAFIPFYHCIKYANAGEQGLAALSCLGDIAGFVPFVKLLSFGFKTTTYTINRFLLTTELSLRTFTLREAIFISLTTGLRNAAKNFNEVLSKVIFTKQTFKKLSVGVIRALDPGFELVAKLTGHGTVFIGNMMNKAFKHISRHFRSLNFKHAKFEILWLQPKGVKPDTEMIPIPENELNGREVFRFIYPGGENPFGPKYIRLSTGHAEFRKMVGFKEEVPVVISRVSKRGKVFYRKVNLQTEEAYGLEMKFNKRSELENVRQDFARHIYKIKTEGFGGRGALFYQRRHSIENAVKLIVDAKVGIGSRMARKTLRHYVLTNESPTTLEDLINVEFMKFDQLKNMEIGDFLPEYKLEPELEPDLNKYLQVPSYTVFALDWARTGKINKVYDQYFVADIEELEKLLFDINLNSMSDLDDKMAKNRITRLYGQYHIDQIKVPTVHVFRKYLTDNAWINAPFEDYYALFTWMNTGYLTISENPIVAKLLNKSLFRLAVRQSTSTEPAKAVYHMKVRDRIPVESDLSTLVDKFMVSDHFIVSTSDEVQLSQIVFDTTTKLTASDSKQIFVYKANIDSSYLTIDLNKLIRKKESLPIVILPKVVFQIKKVEEKIVAGHNVIYFEINNVPIAKEIVITRLMKEIDELS